MISFPYSLPAVTMVCIFESRREIREVLLIFVIAGMTKISMTVSIMMTTSNSTKVKAFLDCTNESPTFLIHLIIIYCNSKLKYHLLLYHKQYNNEFIIRNTNFQKIFASQIKIYLNFLFIFILFFRN